MGNSDSYFERIKNHYLNVWEHTPNVYLWDKGPFEKLNHDFRVLEFSPTIHNSHWVYCTCCMSQLGDERPIELHIFSEKRDESIVELLTVIAYYHKKESELNLWHTINFGRPWQANSLCEYGLISLPYLYGPRLEDLCLDNKEKLIKFYWLIPITKEEVDFKIQNGIEALEQLFEDASLNYVNANRNNVA